MNHELAKTLTTALVQFIDRERPEGTMCCSNTECERIESSFKLGDFPSIEQFVKKKLSRLTEFEQEVSDIVEYCKEHGDDVAFDYAKRHAKTLLDFAKKELLPENTVIFQKGVEEGRRLEREEVTKRSIQGYGDGKQDALRMVKDFVESYLEPYKKKDGKTTPIPPGVACKSPQCYTDVMVAPNINSGTSTLKAEG